MCDLPTISLVTPSLNQVNYVEKTLQGIHGQEYPYLEHIVMDGGSTDGSEDMRNRSAYDVIALNGDVVRVGGN